MCCQGPFSTRGAWSLGKDTHPGISGFCGATVASGVQRKTFIFVNTQRQLGSRASKKVFGQGLEGPDSTVSHGGGPASRLGLRGMSPAPSREREALSSLLTFLVGLENPRLITGAEDLEDFAGGVRLNAEKGFYSGFQ